MKHICLFFCFGLISLGLAAKELKVLQLNIWQETTMVQGGFDGLVNEIVRLDPDIVLFSEIRNYQNKRFIPTLLQALEKKGVRYQGESSTLDVGILSKYEILRVEPLPSEAILKAYVNIEGYEWVIYSAHLDYTRYACYLPRGYDGTTWEKMEHPIVDSKLVEEANKKSSRDEEIGEMISDAASETGKIILLGGDFNEPSHLDWRTDTKDMWEHHGAVVNWDCSVLLRKAGFEDAYRVKYPDPVAYPGFTYPADNKDVDINRLDWVPEADGRDRIDFIYYKPSAGLKLKDIIIVGPEGTIAGNRRVQSGGNDKFILPQGVWPSDHKGVLATFTLETKKEK